MKKLLSLIFAVATLTSCYNSQHPDVVKVDFEYAYSTYDCLTHQVKLDYMMRVYDTKGLYRPDTNELADTLKNICGKIVSESFDSLYIKYGDDTVKEMIYRDKNIVLNNKEELHAYFINSAVKDILDGVTMQVQTQAILNPTDEDKIKAISDCL